MLSSSQAASVPPVDFSGLQIGPPRLAEYKSLGPQGYGLISRSNKVILIQDNV